MLHHKTRKEYFKKIKYQEKFLDVKNMLSETKTSVVELKLIMRKFLRKKSKQYRRVIKEKDLDSQTTA